MTETIRLESLQKMLVEASVPVLTFMSMLIAQELVERLPVKEEKEND